jgi:hypothetical protein
LFFTQSLLAPLPGSEQSGNRCRDGDRSPPVSNAARGREGGGSVAKKLFKALEAIDERASSEWQGLWADFIGM